MSFFGNTTTELWRISAHDYRPIYKDTSVRAVLLFLLLIDALAVTTDVGVTLLKHQNNSADSWYLDFFRLDTEYGAWAFYGYAKLAAITWLLFAVFSKTRMVSYLLLAMVFAYTTLDDALLIHERAGRAIVASGSLAQLDGSIGTAVGEVIYFLVAGALILSLLFFAVRSASRPERPHVVVLALLMLAIGFFAVLVNLIEGALTGVSRFGAKASSLLDDGGELMVSSFALVYALSIWRRAKSGFSRSLTVIK